METYHINLRFTNSNEEKRALVLENINDVLEAYYILNETVKLFVGKGYKITWAQISLITPEKP